jgi:CHASE2 domain-containing sensor protein
MTEVDPCVRDRRLRRALEVCVAAFLVAIGGFGVAALGYMQAGWWIIAIAAAVNIISMLAFLALKLQR